MTYARNMPTYRDWMDDAACAKDGRDLWYADDSETRRLGEAKRICRACPVQTKCLEHALAIEAADERTNLRYGIYGGLTPKERAELTKGNA